MKKYIDVLVTEFKNQLAYIPAFMLKNIFFVVIMLVFFSLWSVVYSSGGANGILSLKEMVWYLTFTECIELSRSTLYWNVQEEVKGGAIAYTLSRPYSYSMFQISKGVGESLIKLVPLLLIGFTIASVLVGFLPGYFKALPLGILVLIGGIVLNSVWHLIIGLCAFWVEDAFPFLLVFQKVVFVFGGLFFPIEFLPKWGQGLAQVLPFTFSAYWPASLMLNFSFNRFLYVFGGQILWIFILYGVAVLMFKTAVRRLHVQGG